MSQTTEARHWDGCFGTAMLCVFCIFALAGCGAEEYRSRLAQTVQYFNYLEELNQNLSLTKWKEAGIEYRVPKQFKPVAIPEPEAAGFEEPNDSDEPPVSPQRSDGDNELHRPPPSNDDPLGHLPGLVGAWEARVGVEGQDADQPAYLYVLSNYDLWLLDEGGDSALNFHETSVFELTSALGVAPPAENEWHEETLPPGKGYVASKTFTVTAPPLTADLNGMKYDVVIYRHRVEDIQVVIAFIVPKNTARRENLEKRIPLSLETLSVSGEKPVKGETESRGGERGSGF